MASYCVKKFPLHYLLSEVWVLGSARIWIFHVDAILIAILNSLGARTRNVAYKDPIWRPFGSKVFVKISKTA